MKAGPQMSGQVLSVVLHVLVIYVGQVFIDSSNVCSPVSFKDCPREKEFIGKVQKDTAEVHNLVLNVHTKVLSGNITNRQQYSFILVQTQAHHSASLSWLKLQIHFHGL